MERPPREGAIVYFSRMKTSTHPSAGIFKDKKGGHFFGVLLGHITDHTLGVTRNLVTVKLGSIGFIAFDEITEFLGAEVTAELIKKFEHKYCGEVPAPEPEAKVIEKRVPTIVGVDGKPLESGPDAEK